MNGHVAFAAVSIVALASVVSLPATASQTGPTTISEYCRSHDDFQLSHGACVAYLQNHNIVPHDATVCADAGIRQMLGVANHGQCLKELALRRK